MKKLLRISAATVATVGLMTGVASAQTNSGTIEDTGRRSNNEIKVRQYDRTRVENDNRVGVHNDTNQYARSGEARSEGRRGGDARTGNAGNTATTRTNVSVNNTNASSAGMNGGSGASTDANISNTGRNSNNEVDVRSYSSRSVENDNNVWVTNDTNQMAKSGDATVEGRRGGDAVTGNATNTSTTETTVRVSN